MQQNLSRRQQQILNFITSEVTDKGYPPSVREIGAAVGLSSSSTVHSHLAAIERKGFIRRDPSKPRALELLNVRRSRATTVPLVGQVAAGTPILAAENVEELVSLPADFADERCFLLRVKGDSMTGAGILDGDLAIVSEQPTANQGDIVVALIDEEATIKRFYRDNGRIRLQPENPGYEPMYVRDVRVVGKVVGLLRQY